MPPAVIAAGVGAAGALGGAAITSHAAGGANKAQSHATDQALAYQREKDAAAQKRYERDYADYQQRLAAREATRRAIAKRYGIDLPDAPAPAAAPPPAVPGDARPALQPRTGGPTFSTQPVQRPMAAPMPAAPMVGGAPPLAAEPAGLVPMGPTGPQGPAGPVPDASTWNDWSRYARLQ